MLILCIADVERDVGMKNLSPKEAITILEGMRIDIPVPKAAVTQIKRNLALDMAINALNCSEIPNNWIPCSERQPDKGDDYLVTLWDDGRTWVEIALWNETFGGRWQAVLYNDVDYSDISNVIAWMPLPEPYQERGEHK